MGFSISFVYSTDTAPDGQPQMIDQRGKIHPALWAPFTRAGCDVGAFSIANIEFENITTDIDNVFGPTSPGHVEANTAATKAQAVADFEGIAVQLRGQQPAMHRRPTGPVAGRARRLCRLQGDAINGIAARRNLIAGRMIAMLEAAAFDNTPIDEHAAEELIDAAQELIESAE